MDGHGSHYNNAELFRLARENCVELIGLPSHTTNYLQPLDKAVFFPLKQAWKTRCRRFMVRNPGKVITRSDFGELFSSSWRMGVKPEHAISGFLSTGLYPLDLNKIPHHAYAISNALLSVDEVEKEITFQSSDPGPSNRFQDLNRCFADENCSDKGMVSFDNLMPALNANSTEAEAALKRMRKPKIHMNETTQVVGASLQNTVPKHKTGSLLSKQKVWICRPCKAVYSSDKSGVPWIQCLECLEWEHETCGGKSTKAVFFCKTCVSSVAKLLT